MGNGDEIRCDIIYKMIKAKLQIGTTNYATGSEILPGMTFTICGRNDHEPSLERVLHQADRVNVYYDGRSKNLDFGHVSATVDEDFHSKHPKVFHRQNVRGESLSCRRNH